jgi:hypothetical protein
MAWGALSLAIASFICIGLGVLFTPVPGVGAVFAFGAPLLALAGIIVGGRAVSRAKAVVAGVPGPGGAMISGPGEASGLAQAAVIASALAFVPAMITALTCGACNALCATADFRTSHQLGGGIDPLDMLRRAGMQQAGGSGGPDPGITVPSAPADGGVPNAPSTLPPPPLAPGPPP